MIFCVFFLRGGDGFDRNPNFIVYFSTKFTNNGNSEVGV